MTPFLGAFFLAPVSPLTLMYVDLGYTYPWGYQPKHRRPRTLCPPANPRRAGRAGPDGPALPPLVL